MSDPTKVDHDIAHLYPPFALQLSAAIEQVNIELLHHDGLPRFYGRTKMKLFEGFRSQSRQTMLYNQGRTTPGNIVTNAKTTPYHGTGLAADVVFLDEHGNYTWDAPEGAWQIWGHCVRAHGMEWGGDWKGSLGDTPHAQVSKENYPVWKPKAMVYLKN